MIKLIFKIVVIFLAVIFQVVLMPILNIKGFWPNFILISSVVLILFDMPSDAYLTAGIGGLMFDIFSPLNFGLSTLFFIGAVFGVNLLIKKYFPAINLYIIVSIVFLSSLLYGLFSSLILRNWLGWGLILESIYAAILGLIFFFVLSYFHKPSQIIKVEQ